MPTISYISANGRASSLTVGVDPASSTPSVGGQIVLLSDALGSVVRTVNDESTNGGETLRYAWYGSVLYEAGAWAQPRCGWVGSLGYRSTQLRHAEQYVRARHYAASAGRWTSVDPLWPGEAAYGYIDGNPVSWSDPSGMAPCGRHPCTQVPPDQICQWAKDHQYDGGDGGGVFCCEGKKYACSWLTPGAPSGVVKCVKRHEIFHRDNDVCSPPGTGRGHSNPPSKNDSDECVGNNIEIGCLVGSMAADCAQFPKGSKARDRCIGYYNTKISGDCDAMKTYHCPKWQIPSTCRGRI